MRVIILAAGIGKRLRPITEHTPKCLLTFDGKALIECYFNSFSKHGIHEAAIVLGHLAEMVRRKLGDEYLNIRIKYVYNKAYAVSGSGYSLWMARENLAGQSFILADGDVLFHDYLFEKLVRSEYENCLIVDPVFTDTGEEVKVFAEGNLVKHMGKGLSSPNCVGEVVGLYKFSSGASKLLLDGLESFIDSNGKSFEHEDVLDHLLSSLEMHYVTTDGFPWIEIDFPEDLEKGRSVIYPKLKGDPSC